MLYGTFRTINKQNEEFMFIQRTEYASAAQVIYLSFQF